MCEKVPIRNGLFVQDDDGAALVGNKCTSCGRIFFPKAHLCLACGEEDTDDMTLSRKGRLYSYTVAHMPTPYLQPPYAVGYVVLPEKVRVFAPLKMREEKPFEVGMEMELVVEKLWDDGDKEIIGYKFTPT
ncbi:Zn-ribbon domain-containing OB-fold protein [Thermodesulfobacteriota bacterium]